MIDKFEFEIPFKDHYVDSTQEGESGEVDIKNFDLSHLKCSISRVDGVYDVDRLDHPWESIASSFTPMAVKVFKGGNYWPYVAIKASPAKLLQGHNVFGPDDPVLCGCELLTLLAVSLPRLSQALDYKYTRIKNIDCTYSISFKTAEITTSVLESIRNVKHKQLNKSQGHFDTTVYFNKGSEHGCLAIYHKAEEVDKQIKDYSKENRQGHYDHVISILSNDRLQEFSKNRLRFEARLTRRKMQSMNVPTLWVDFCKSYKSNLKDNINLIQSLFWSKMKPLFEALEGANVNVYNDDDIRDRLRAHHVKVRKDGSLNYDQAMNSFRTYRLILADGYTLTQDAMAKATFYRHIKMMVDAGIPKAALQSIKPHCNRNVIPMVHFVKIDFSNQFPEWYEEPKSQFENDVLIRDTDLLRNSLKLVV